MAKRGQLNERVQAVAKRFLGVGLTTTELRLIPYLQYVMINSQKLDMQKINEEERTILAKWKARDFLEGGASGLTITVDFWNFMCEILLWGYVGHEDCVAVKDKIREN